MLGTPARTSGLAVVFVSWKRYRFYFFWQLRVDTLLPFYLFLLTAIASHIYEDPGYYSSDQFEVGPITNRYDTTIDSPWAFDTTRKGRPLAEECWLVPAPDFSFGDQLYPVRRPSQYISVQS